MDTSLGQQGTLISSNDYYRTGFPMNYFGNSNNNWYNTNSTRWELQNGGSSRVWNGEITFPIATAVGASGNRMLVVCGRTTTEDRDDRSSCIQSSSTTYTTMIVGARIYNDSGNAWTEGTMTWYGLKKS